MIRRAFLLIFLFFSTLTAAAQTADTDIDDSIVHDGKTRTFRVHLPAGGLSDQPTALVFVLHRSGSKGAEIQVLTGFDAAADESGFIAVYPDGLYGDWNDGEDLTVLRTVREDTDDVGFIAALIDHLAEQYPVDPERVYATGYSNGAAMSYRLACELADRIAAIAPVGALLTESQMEGCAPRHPVSVLMILGTQEPVFFWEGGDVLIDGKPYGYRTAAVETLDFWLRQNECEPLAEVTLLPDLNPEDGTRAQRQHFSECAGSRQVELLAVQGGGHNWPGVPADLPPDFAGKVSYDFEATAVITAFFAAQEA